MNRHISLGYFLIFVFFAFVNGYSQVLSIDELKLNNKVNPMGVDSGEPSFTWILSSDERGAKQTAYRVQVSRAGDFSGSLVWDSGKEDSDQSIHVLYGGSTLESGEEYYWRVKVWDHKGGATDWSETANWRMGLLSPSDWHADWIGIGYKEPDSRPSPIFRGEFDTGKEVSSATAYITAHGLYEAYLNGKKIGDDYLTPGWTSYNERLQYQSYDVTDMLESGENAVGAILGSGWFRSVLGWEDNLDIYGSDLAFLMQIEIRYTDGSSEIVGTGDDWLSTESSIKSSEIYNGETVDARDGKEGWSRPGYDTSGWVPVELKQIGKDQLIGTYNEPVRKQEHFKPIEVLTTPEGDKVIDFGQNLVGWVEVSARGQSGDSIVLDHAEVLDKEGNFYTENLRSADQRNVYVLKGDGEENFRPHFTWQGFRYVRVRGNGEINPDDYRAVALYSDMKKTGEFTSSSDLLNQLQHNIQWGQNGNFLDVPTDCPQRDERLGWTGDAQAFFTTAAYNRDVYNFFSKWMKDVASEQYNDGNIPFVIPNVLGKDAAGSTGWEDVATIIPWNMYLLYGNKRILEDQYSSMKGWVDFMDSKSNGYLWNTGFHFGDWLFYSLGSDDPSGRSAITDKYLIAQAFFAHSTQLLINAAEVLGKSKDIKKYGKLLKEVKDAFMKEYVTPKGNLISNTQTAYVLALNFDLLPKDMRKDAANRLVENIKSYDYHLTTGFLGTPYLAEVLTRFGHHDVAYTLLMQQTYPSWLYQVTKGATTMWERWDGIKEDGSFQTASMNSFNHYAYGAIGNWMYRTLAGINSSEDSEGIGYKKIIIKPYVDNQYLSDEVLKQNNGEKLTEVEGRLMTGYGEIKSHWKKADSGLLMDITIPANTTAMVYIPSNEESKISESKESLSDVDGIEVLDNGDEDGYILVSVGSGTYNFKIE